MGFILANAIWMENEVRALNLLQGVGLFALFSSLGLVFTLKWNIRWIGIMILLVYALSLMRSFSSVDSTYAGIVRNLFLLSLIISTTIFYKGPVALFLISGTFLINLLRYFAVKFGWMQIMIVQNAGYYEVFYLSWLFVYAVIVTFVFKRNMLRMFAFQTRMKHTIELSLEQLKERIRNKNRIFDNIRRISIQKLAQINELSADIRSRLESDIHDKSGVIRPEITQLSSAIDAILRDIDRLSMQGTIEVTSSVDWRKKYFRNQLSWGNLKVLDRAFIMSMFIIIAVYFGYHPQPLEPISIGIMFIGIIALFVYFLGVEHLKQKAIIACYVCIASFLLYARLKYTSVNGASPYLSLVEISYSVILLYRFSNAVLMLLPISFLLLSILTPISMAYNWPNHWFVIELNGIKLIILFMLAGFSFFGIIRFFKRQLELRMLKAEQSFKRLRNTQQKLRISQKQLNNRLLAIRNLADRNSHEVRRPVARIQSLFQVMDECHMSIEEMQADAAINVREVSLKSLDELDYQLNYLHQLLLSEWKPEHKKLMHVVH